jgi:hypothetical protein
MAELYIFMGCGMSAEAPLAQRMRDAADTLEEASDRMGWGKNWSWQPTELRREATHVEDEDREAAEREALVEELTQSLADAQQELIHDKTATTSIRDSEAYKTATTSIRDGEAYRRNLRRLATKLIESGWGKQ